VLPCAVSRNDGRSGGQADRAGKGETGGLATDRLGAVLSGVDFIGSPHTVAERVRKVTNSVGGDKF